jgi:hypothetical protein
MHADLINYLCSHELLKVSALAPARAVANGCVSPKRFFGGHTSRRAPFKESLNPKP